MSKFINEITVEVGENGTESNNVKVNSDVQGLRSSHCVKDNVEDFICDRPFLYIIHETKLNGILFLGKITDPSQ